MSRHPWEARATEDEPEWHADAACAQTDPDMFFPDPGGAATMLTANAKTICVTCEVREQCLQWALDNNERFGVWGGLTRRERIQLERRAA